jgi:hypothetical protein
MKRITLITFASAFAACSSSSSPSTSTSGPATAEDYDDTAQAIGTMAMTGGGGGDVGSFGDAVMVSRGAMPFGLGLKGDGRIHGNRQGLDYSYTAVCKDATGAVLTKCDKTTDQAQIDVSWSGSLKTPSFSADVARKGSWTITGLQSDTASLSGDSSFTLDTTMTSIFHGGATSTLSIDASAMYNAIQIAMQSHEPVGGSAAFSLAVHRTVTGTGSCGSGAGSGAGSGSGSGSGSGAGSGSGTGSDDGSGHDGSDDHGRGHGDDDGSGHDCVQDVDKTFSVTATITFNADHTADLTINGTEHFTIDLTTGSIKRAA